jgi:hypothetical protein
MKQHKDDDDEVSYPMGPPEPIGSSAPGDETSVFKLVFNGFIMIEEMKTILSKTRVCCGILILLLI